MKPQKTNKLFAVLAVLSKEELKDFDIFVNSSFFNTNKNVCKTLAYIKKIHPDFTGKNAEPAKVYSVLFSGKKFNEQILNNLYTEVNKLLKRYFALKEFECDDDLSKICYIRNLTKKKLVQQSLLEIKKGVEKIEDENYDTYRKQKVTTGLLLEQIGTIMYTSDHHQYLEAEIKKTESFTYQYLLDLSLSAINIHIYRQYFTTKLQNQLSDVLWNSIDFNRLIKKIDAIDTTKEADKYLYLKMILMGNTIFLGENNFQDFLKLKEILKAEYHKFVFDDKHKLWDMMIKILDYSVSKYYKDYNNEIHQINKFCIDNGALINETLVNNGTFVLYENRVRNCFAYAIRVNDWEWAESFVEKHSKYMSDEVRDNTYHYLIGQCKMQKKQFGEAMEHFSKVKLKDGIINIDIRNFYLKCLYELGYWEELLAAIDSFNHYLDYQDVPVDFANTDFKSLFKYLKILTKIKTDGAKFDSSLLYEAENTPSFLSKSWIILKIKELIN